MGPYNQGNLPWTEQYCDQCKAQTLDLKVHRCGTSRPQALVIALSPERLKKQFSKAYFCLNLTKNLNFFLRKVKIY